MPNCLDCHRPLVPFGDFRKNGKSQSDWVGRQYHKQCWKTLKHYDTFFDVPFDKKDEAKQCGAKWNPDMKLWFSSNNAVHRNMINESFNVHKIVCEDCKDTGTVYYCDDVYGGCPHCEKGIKKMREQI